MTFNDETSHHDAAALLDDYRDTATAGSPLTQRPIIVSEDSSSDATVRDDVL
jgi:hypothetical protein